MHVKTEATYRCNAEAYWEELFDAERRTRRELEGCDTVAFEVRQQRHENGVAEQESVMEVKVDAPGPVRKVFGQTTRIVESGTKKDTDDFCSVVFRSEKIGDKATMAGTLRCVEQSDGTSQVTLELDLKVKIFGIGGMVEKIVAEQLAEHFQKDAKWFNANYAK